MAPTTRRARRAFADLLTDVLFDIFLLLSAKELCRLRVVCRAWRSLTRDPRFIRAHTARHPHGDPLFVASFLLPSLYGQMRMQIDLIDLSGKTLKRVASAMGSGQVLCPRLGLVFVASRFDRTCCVLDPASADAGAPVLAPRFRLPVLAAPSHRGPGSWNRLHYDAARSFAFGRVAATGEHKLLRIFHRFRDDKHGPHLFEVLTIAGRRRRVCAQWREMQSPDMFVCPESSVVVDGVAFFLRNALYKDMAATLPSAGGDIIVPPADCVASFDLEREEWRKRLQGPISIQGGEPKVNLNDPLFQFALAELKGSLVQVHYYWSRTHIWMLTDFETGVWVKQYSIPSNSIVETPHYRHRLEPLFVLDDGRLLVRSSRDGGQLAVYDPSTDDCTRVDSGPLHVGVVRVYGGSLLGLQDV